ncbi:copper homeostasis periplasmic binding protein CopC [Sphingobium sp. KCTC 72723]|uniref:copper homeostasis periplasmic binding protein CopC n=1 Tax=Sphingobium sp. KCTC 72723 TaxID=2733867 RepID=UPI00165DB143|nr:copper homeostasis periplasmic binding protein CopC [Sphingobium sp. KCTC 72723]
MKSVRVIGAAIAAALVTITAPAIAHPKLISSTPAAQATVTNATQVSLTFSETLMAPVSGIDLAMTGMPGMANHAPMKIAGFKTSVAADGKTLVAVFPRPLPAGTYKLDWHAVSTDTHRITGTLAFTVR